jgi:transposase
MQAGFFAPTFEWRRLGAPARGPPPREVSHGTPDRLVLWGMGRIATRYDRLAANFLSAIYLAATVSYWL